MTRELCYRGTVNTWECDEMGHMNVRFYLGKAHQGLVHLGVMLGLGPRALDEMGANLVLTEQHIRFLRELQAGADLAIEAGVVEASASELTVFQDVLPLAASHVSATLVSKLVLVDRKSGQKLALPSGALERAKELATEIPGHGQPRSLPLDMNLPELDEIAALTAGHLPVSMAAVRSDQIDGTGHLYPDQFMGHLSDGIGNLFGLVTKGLDEEVYERTEERGGAALEYRFQFLQRVPLGSAIKILSAPFEVLEKIYTLNHVIVDAETGSPCVLARSVHVAFNLQTRKSIPVPDRLRRGLEAHKAALA